MTSPDAPQEAAPPAATAQPNTPAVTETPPQVDDTLAVPAPAPSADADPASERPADAAPDIAPEPQSAAAEPRGAPAAAAPAAPDLSPAATGRRLAALFPALFVGPDGKGTWKAIKLRIHADIQARAPGEFSKRALAIFFSRYTTTTAYLKALAAPDAKRHDLDGQPVGEIAEEHRSAASEEVGRREAIVAERRAAARNAPGSQRRSDAAASEESETSTPSRPPRGPRPPRDGGTSLHRADRRDVPRQQRPARAMRREAPQHARDGEGRGGSGTPRDARGAPRQEPRPVAREPAPPALPADPAQRERALLLRAFESSPLSKANFCALKRMSEAELDTLLAQARAERAIR